MVLRNADIRVTVDAAHGGAIREFSWRGIPILRPAAAATDSNPFSTSCFALVPYANRIAHGRFVSDATEGTAAAQLGPGSTSLAWAGLAVALDR